MAESRRNKEVNPLAPGDLQQFVRRAQNGDERAREHLVRQYRDFVYEVVCRLCRRRMDWRNDDELSVGLMALNEAIDRYEPDRGAPFRSLIRALIRSRVIDHWRSEDRHRVAASLNGTAGDIHPFEMETARDQHRQDEALWERRAEIELFEEELARFGIDLQLLEESSPSHRNKRNRLREAALQLARDPDLLQTLMAGGRLPIKVLAQKTGLSRKVLEGSRRYLIALVLIATRDHYEHLRSFVGLPLVREEEDDQCDDAQRWY